VPGLRFNLNSITTRLIIFGVSLLLIGATGRLLVLSHYLRGSLIETNSAQLETLTNHVARSIGRELDRRRTLLTQLSTRLPAPLLADPATLESRLSEIGAINPTFSQGLVLLSVQGVPLARTVTAKGLDPLPWPHPGLSDADTDTDTDTAGKIGIGKPFVDSRTAVPLLPMVAPVFDGHGQLQAYLIGLSALNRSGFLQALHVTPIDSAAELMLISPTERLTLGTNLDGPALGPLPEAGMDSFGDKALAGYRGTELSRHDEGDDTLDAAVSVPGSDWILIARLPTAEIYRPQAELRRFILHNTGFLILIVLVVVTLGVRYLLGPLRHAAAHADRMMLDEIPLAPLPIVRNDEVGHLTQAFNRVLAKLLDSQAELQHRAHRDPLTGLPNRHLLADRMTQALARAQRNQSWVAVLFLDLDLFKPINDLLGHDAGDQALQQVAARLQGALRRVDTLARVGGDEFVILLTDLGTDAEEATATVAQKCLDTFEQEFTIKGESCRLGTSIGIALGNGDCSPDKLLIAADKAMYRSKLSGCGEVCWSSSEPGAPARQASATLPD